MPPKTQQTDLQSLHDAIITKQIYLQRYADDLSRRVIRRIDTTESELVKFLERRLNRFGAVAPSVKTNAKFTEIQKGVSEIRKPIMLDARQYVSGELSALADNEAAFTQKSVEHTLDGIATKAVPNAVVKQIVNHGIFSGATIREWFSELADNDVSNIMQHVRYGMTQGFTTDQIIRGLRGTAKANYRDGRLQITRNHAAAVTRTVTNGVANSAKFSYYSQNSDVVAYVRFSATLDGRTSPICQAMDGRQWKNPDELGAVKLPPLHPNCRSTTVPIIKGFKTEPSTRPAANADFAKDAERRYNDKQRENNRSRRWQDLAPSTRDKYYYKEIQLYEQRTGKPAFTKNFTGTYADYLKRQPASVQKDILGASRYELYKKGGYTPEKFINRNTGQPFTLTELAKKDKEVASILNM